MHLCKNCIVFEKSTQTVIFFTTVSLEVIHITLQKNSEKLSYTRNYPHYPRKIQKQGKFPVDKKEHNFC